MIPNDPKEWSLCELLPISALCIQCSHDEEFEYYLARSRDKNWSRKAVQSASLILPCVFYPCRLAV